MNYRSIFYRPFKSLYQKNDDYFRNRIMFILESCSCSAIGSLTGGTFLAGFAALLGASDRYTGLLAVLSTLAAVAQLIAPFILEKIVSRKLIIVIFLSINRVFTSAVIFIPLFIQNQKIQLISIFIILFVAYLSNNMVWPGFSSWMINSIPNNVKGKFFGLKDSFTLAFNTVIVLIMGFVLDHFKKDGMQYPSYTGYLIVFLVALCLTIPDILSMTAIKEIPVVLGKSTLKIRECILMPLKNRKFFKVILLSVFWNIGWNIATPFIAVYQVKYLNLDYKHIVCLTLLSNLSYITVVRYWGRIADRHSWFYTLIYSITILSATNFMWTFVTRYSLFLLPIVFILTGIGISGVNISLFNIPFVYAPEENRTIYIGVNATFSGITSLLTTLVAGQIITSFNGKSIQLSFLPVSSIQFLMFISSLILFSGSLFMHILEVRRHKSINRI